MSVQTLKRGFVLHRRDYRNTSLLIELFTADEGRLVCVAKGAKSAPRGRSALAALLQPFQPLWLGWVGRGEVKTLTRAEAAAPSIALVAERLYCGFYLNELLIRLLDREDPHEALFVFYQQALADLASEPLDAVLRRFELRLLEELGYALDLRSDRQGKPIEPVHDYRYTSDQGLNPVPGLGVSFNDPVAALHTGARMRETQIADDAVCEPAGAERFAVETSADKTSPDETSPDKISPAIAQAAATEVMISGGTLQRLASGAPLQRGDLAPARALMRAALAPHLGPKPLRSRELFRRPST
ncbi:DNA repair protein RecO [Lamprobacter modestohalophilus]|uniref:DNA repair protein RecO n=1 Tax=Lamprobacter modestohalophilus TaxID=1064514 RepID=A0A9X0W5Z2_9GAMM|nr:DNA repair protein RecO [Lamprobacter modestohalophilus]MBK1617465.1 DNA repair protein RecO [Lamprobacter modestohalophilus]